MGFSTLLARRFVHCVLARSQYGCGTWVVVDSCSGCEVCGVG
jgi:hypothetical protein